MKFLDKITENLKYHVVDSTALLAESNPVFSAFEVGVAGLSDSASINARMLATTIAYGGVGYLFGKGRDLSRKIFKITDKTKEKIQNVHDIAYTAAFNLAISPPMYAISQTLAGEEIELKKIAIGTVVATGFGMVNGLPMGYAVDTFRDLSGIKECNRPSYPKFLKNIGSKTKKAILVGLVGVSVGTMGLIYSFSQNTKPEITPKEKSTIEQKVSMEEDYSPRRILENRTQ